jgi:hypothetical protein
VTLDDWQAVGIVCGALIALLTLIGLIYRWVARPVWRTLRRLNEVADQLLGDKRLQIPSMTERMKALEAGQAVLNAKLAEHLEWHGRPSGQPARPRDEQDNGPRPRPGQRRG